jgi:glucose/arabinose dehydrogenase
MRRSSLLVFLAACGGGGGDGPDGPPPIDGRDVGDGAVASCTPKNGTTIGFEDVVSGLDSVLLVTAAPGDPRLFVIEQPGVIRVIKDGQVVAAPFLDLSGANGLVQCCSEQGLLGLAFHPDFLQNDRFYVHFTARTGGDHVIAEYKANFGTDTADAGSKRELLRFTDPYTNHNAGSLEFGTDGMLYIGFGDGGSGGDPQDRAQDLTSLFGKILRIDVDERTGTKEYGIPADNPYASSADGAADPRPEVWHYGLRNPFRFTFDPANGDIYIGDVGQETWEEIDVSPNLPNINWGWDDREGSNCYEPSTGCQTSNRVDPVVQFSHSQGWASIMGGAVYRGPCFPDLVGTYFYADYYAGRLWAFEYAGGVAQNNRQVSSVNLAGLTSVHAGATGELYVSTINGQVRRIIVP